MSRKGTSGSRIRGESMDSGIAISRVDESGTNLDGVGQSRNSKHGTRPTHESVDEMMEDEVNSYQRDS